MICITIGRGRHSSLLAEWKAAADAGAELVELRIDCLRRDPDLKRILGNRLTPVVFTIRRGADGGLWRGDEEKRRRLIREAIVMGVEYVDLEADTALDIPRPRFGKTQRIVSIHNFKKTPQRIEELAEQIAKGDPDVTKIACLAQNLSDASRMLAFVGRTQTPTIGICMGPLGLFTRILGAKFGAPFTYAGFNPDLTFAPGMPRFGDLRSDYQYDRINGETEVYAVIGDPIGHSLSPAIHNAAFRKLGLNKVMVPIQIPVGTLKESLAALSWLNIQGISVTIPHKEAIIPLMNAVDKSVERTGACNTVLNQGGKLVGHNTDYRAAMVSLEQALGGSPGDEHSAILDKQVLILGAGGVARSIAFGLSRRGAGITVCNRNEERGVKLAEEVGCRAINWAMRAGTPCDVIINATPVGMHPNVDESPVPPAAFRPGMVVFDTVYHPENTLFLKLGQSHECITITGVDMFVYQAALQFRYYTGQDAPVELMREIVRKKLNPAKDD
ncbi:MAG: shikimate 5-dehydrogenase [Planctomycetota bacterium]|nr:shikimate 5-dehydrogenase [Planctomycetota bacterium]